MAGASHQHICASDSGAHGLREDVGPGKDGPARKHGHIDLPTRNAGVPQRLTTQPSNIPRPRKPRQNIHASGDFLSIHPNQPQ